VHPSELWNSPEPGPRLTRAALTPLSWLYAAGWQAYAATYRLGFKRASEPHPLTVVVGNLSIGGSGKSPTVKYLAGLLADMGRNVVIGCSGYGSPRAEAASLAPDGPLDPAEWGDEPSMFRWLMPQVPLVVGRRRVLAASLVHEHYPEAVLLMDDGFQHLPLKKHVSILLEAKRPANSKTLPAGPYREPRSSLRRADAVVWTDEVAQADGFRLRRDPMRFVLPSGRETEVGKATALCALGQPERFLRELEGRMQVVSPLALADHDPLTAGTLFDRLPKDLPVVVTAKDWVKLRQRHDIADQEIVIALQDVRIEPEQAFKAWLAAKLDEQKNKNR
jgi:tetraacyldisaccharide 4'-kinase